MQGNAATIAADVIALAGSRLFDADWYVLHYPDSVTGGRDPLIHFCDIGWRLGYQPNAWFDPGFYLRRNHDVREAGHNPLRHYMHHGEAEGRRPSAAFDPRWYKHHHTDVRDAGISPLAHFLAYGAAEGRRPRPPLAPSGKGDKNSQSPPLHQARESGDARRTIAASGLFDANFYLASYPDVRSNGQDPLDHFWLFGWREGRRPNPYFDPAWYCRQYLNTGPNIDINPLLHYIDGGELLGLRPTIYFETVWYKRAYGLAEGVPVLRHYLGHRRAQRHSPLSHFDVAFYMSRWGRAIGPNRDPFAHFLRAAIYRDVDPSPSFNLARYRTDRMPAPPLLTNPQPGKAFLAKTQREHCNPLVHFLLQEQVVPRDAASAPSSQDRHHGLDISLSPAAGKFDPDARQLNGGIGHVKRKEAVLLNVDASLTRRSLLLGAVAAAVAANGPAIASDAAPPLALPASDPILTVSGKITRHNQGNTAVFDMAAIEALGLEGFTTLTPWTKRVKFEGVYLQKFLDYLGASGQTLVCTALNDYACEIPLDMIKQDNPLMATRINGQYMPIDHFGPLFVIFDFDRHPEWQSNTIYNRCPWQLQTMRVV